MLPAQHLLGSGETPSRTGLKCSSRVDSPHRPQVSLSTTSVTGVLSLWAVTSRARSEAWYTWPASQAIAGSPLQLVEGTQVCICLCNV